MAAEQIRTIRDMVKDTSTFQNLSNIRKTIISKRKNMINIEHGVNVSNNIGYDKWERQSNSLDVNKQIVRELVQ